MRRRVTLGVLILSVLGLVGLWLLREDPVPTLPVAVPAPLPVVSARVAPAPKQPTPGVLRGAVTWNGQAQPGAAVIVTVPRGTAKRFVDDCQIPSACPTKCDDPVAPVAQAVTDADGRFEVADLPAGPFSVWAEHERGAVMVINVEAGGADVELALVAWRRISGRLLDDDDAPVPNVRIRALAYDRSRQHETRTSSEGEYSVRIAAMGFWVIAASAPGFFVNSEILDPAQTEWNEPLERDPALTLTGRVVRLNEPVAGATVTLTGDDCSVVAQTAADGMFRFSPLTSNANSFVRAQSGSQAISRAVDLEEGTFVELKLADPTRLEGVVRDFSGRPISGAQVTLDDGPGGDCDHAGRFSFETSLEGPWRLTVKAAGFLEQDLTAKKPRAILVSMTRGQHVRGVVKTPSGEPIVGALVTAPITRTEHDEVQTGTGGAFEFFVSEGGPLRLVAMHQDYAPASVSTPVPADRVTLVLRDGLTVEGRVVDAMGAGVVGAFVGADRLEARTGLNDQLGGYRTSGSDGRFTLRGLVAGKHRVTARFPDGSDLLLTSVDVAVPARGSIELRFGGGASLHGVVLDSKGAPIARVDLVAEPEGNTEGDSRTARSREDGTFVLKNLAPGSHSIEASRAGFIPTSQRASTGGERVELRMRRQTTVTGRVLSPGGRPQTKFSLSGMVLDVRTSSSSSTLREVSTPDGKFSEGLTRAIDRLVIEAEGCAPLSVPMHEVLEGVVHLGDLTLPGLRDVTVTLLDAASRPVSGVRLMPSGFFEQAAQTDGQGVARLEGVDSRALVVSLWGVSGSQPKVVLPAGVEATTVRLGGQVNVRGRLDPPRAGLWVTCAPPDSTPHAISFTSADGRFSLSAVGPGRCVLTARAEPDGRVEYGPIEITSPADEVVLSPRR